MKNREALGITLSERDVKGYFKIKNKKFIRYKRKYFESEDLSSMLNVLNKYHATSKVIAIFKDNEKYIAITEKEITYYEEI